MEAFDLAILLRAMISSNLLNCKRCPCKYFFQKIQGVVFVGSIVAPSKYPSCCIINDCVNHFPLLVTIWVLGVHLELFSWCLMGIELLFPTFLCVLVVVGVANIIAFQNAIDGCRMQCDVVFSL